MDASAKLHAIATQLRAEGNGRAMRSLSGTLRAEAKPLVSAAEDAAREKLPKAGGLNELVAGRHTTVSVLTSRASTAGIRLKRARKDAASYQTNRGFIRHRDFGGDWVPEPQQIPGAAGWFTETLEKRAPAVRPALVATLDAIAVRVLR